MCPQGGARNPRCDEVWLFTTPWAAARQASLSLTVSNFAQVCSVLSRSVVSSFATPWTVAAQAPLSMGFSREEYWSGVPCPPPGDLPDPRIEPMSPAALASQANSLPLRHLGSPDLTWKAASWISQCVFARVSTLLSGSDSVATHVHLLSRPSQLTREWPQVLCEPPSRGATLHQSCRLGRKTLNAPSLGHLGKLTSILQ